MEANRKTYSLIAFDMDGTLLDSVKQLHGPVLEAIALALEKGKRVALATGRTRSELEPYRAALDAVPPGILASGACLPGACGTAGGYTHPGEARRRAAAGRRCPAALEPDRERKGSGTILEQRCLYTRPSRLFKERASRSGKGQSVPHVSGGKGADKAKAGEIRL